MPQMKKNKEMKRGDYQCKFYNHIAYIKWYESKSVMLLGSHLEEISSILTVQRSSSSKIPLNCPNCIKLYNSKMGGVDLKDQLKSAYQLDRRSKFRFYLRLFFDLFDVALANSFIVYKKLENKYLTLKEFKICFLRQPKTILSKPSSIQAHQSSKTRPNTSITFANFLGDKTNNVLYVPKQENRTGHLLRLHCAM